ncbi:chloride channel protein [Microbacterium sp. SSW1-59]|uniref:chloride channel protein n=1 Tax=Microbacterium xanthum TaxID=3079794 RepID=UPI002AD1EE54|nr:chloride channel protein [Microbacterium sp. SSW1-59]MDZ8201173.1 chloride channel protein [Microbacterium sp. SSW1-59]
MDPTERPGREGDPARAGLMVLLAAVAAAGLATGFVGGAFRWVLDRATELRGHIVTWALETPAGWIAAVLLTALAAATAAAIVRMSPRSAGSGIQDVEAVVRGEVAPPRLDVIPARFVGGALAIGSGLVLGREGPTVHMGAALGAAAAEAARRDDADVRIAQTALSGAGLAVAFNAPIGGALFVFEEVTHRLSTRLMLATLVAVGVAVACARIIIGNSPDFAVVDLAEAPLHTLPLFVAFGVTLGLLGAAYSSVVVGCLTLAHRLRRIPPTVRAAVVGAVVGAALLYDPLTVSGGDALTQLLLHGQSVALPVVLTYLVIRFFAGPLSYAAGTPGGLFAPLLALGALAGLAFVQTVEGFWPGWGADLALMFVLVGMSTLFAAVVRAPLTGIVLVVEMTAVTSAVIPMIAAGAAAVLTATALRSRPVYDRLREIMLTGKP